MKSELHNEKSEGQATVIFRLGGNAVLKLTAHLIAIAVAAVAIAVSVSPAQEDAEFTPTQVAPPGGTTTNADYQNQIGPPTLQRRNPRYRLAKADVLEVDFPLTPEFNQTLTIQPDGYITLRGAGDLHVEGQTIPELTEKLRVAYSQILHDPIIVVSLKEFEKPHFIVGGQVEHPGKFDLRGDTTISEAIAMAGGLNDSAKNSQVLLFRRMSEDWVEVKKVNLKQMLQAQNLREDMHLRPGDMVFIPKNKMSRIKRFIPYPSLGLYIDPKRY